jgi:hypothetical protein
MFMKINTIKKIITAIILLFTSGQLYSQSLPDTVNQVKQLKTEHSYPEIKGYVGLVHPLYTVSSDGNVANFKDYYIVGNPWGINIWKSKRFGLSFEFTPFIRADKKSSKVSNVLFHPGVLYKIGKEFTLIGRAAYETSGRYGVTPIINKVVIMNKSSTVFVALLFPVRFGNGHAPSYTTAFQFGVGF